MRSVCFVKSKLIVQVYNTLHNLGSASKVFDKCARKFFIRFCCK